MFDVAWGWAGPLATGVVGVAGIVGTYLGTSRQTGTALKVAKTQLDGDLAAKDRERTQGRIATAYTELARWMSLYGAWAAATMPMVSGPDHDPYPVVPGSGTDPSVHIAEALTIYWSEEVIELMKPWEKARNGLVAVSAVSRSDRETGRLSGGLYENAHSHRQAMVEAEQAILVQIRKELRGASRTEAGESVQ